MRILPHLAFRLNVKLDFLYFYAIMFFTEVPFMAQSRSGGFGCLTLFIVALIAHSCGEDEGRANERRKARREIDQLEQQVRQLKADCPAEARR